MILEQDADSSERSVVAQAPAADQRLESCDDDSAPLETPSYWQGVQECERLLEAVWPGMVPLAQDIPRQFGKFTIVRELGRGGFGIVFLAFDTKLRRQVALKLPRPEVMVSPDFRTRFLREAEAASRLEHPHIVTVYEVGEEGPICYIASAYCEGPTLAAWLRSQPRPVPVLVAARLVTILSAAVAHAHERSILHRDIKPGNILLNGAAPITFGTDRASHVLSLYPRICDFGLAKLLDQTSQETCSGVPIGSASYMAPEQATGRLRDQGPATDIYALGVILYELLTRRPPFRGETDLETLRLVSDHEPPSPRSLRTDLPRDLETIILKCLEKQAVRRYATAAALTADLERFLEGKPVRARPVPVWEHARKWVKRRPVHTALGVVVALGLLSAFGLLLWSGAWLRWHQQDKEQAVSLAERDTRYSFNSPIKLTHETFESGGVELASHMLQIWESVPGRRGPDGFALNHVRSLFRPRITQLPDAGLEGCTTLKLVISPDGRTLASGISDGRVLLWDLETEQLRHTLVNGSGPGHEVYFITFSQDGRYLATGSPNNVVKIWNMNALSFGATLPLEMKRKQSQLDEIFELRFTDDASALAVFARTEFKGKFQVWFWSVPSPGEKPRLLEIVDQAQVPKFDREGPLKAPAWPLDKEKTAPWLSFSRKHLVLFDDGATLALKGNAGDVTLYDYFYHTPIARIRAPMNVAVINERPNFGLGPTDSARMSRYLYRVAGCGEKTAPLSNRNFWNVDISPDGRTLAACLENGPHVFEGVSLIDIASNRTLSTNVPTGWQVFAVAFTPDARTLAFGGVNSRIYLWHLTPDALPGHDKETWSLAFSPDGKTLASGSDDATIKLWDVAAGRERMSLKGHESLVSAVAYSPDGALLASASFDKKIRLWDAARGAVKDTLHGHTDYVRALAFSPDGKILASAGSDRAIRLWDVYTGDEITAPLGGHTAPVFSLVFSPDCKTLYSAGDDKTIAIWDVGDGRRRQTWNTEDRVYSLALAPDGRTLAAGHRRGSVALWDVAEQKPKAILRGLKDDVLGLSFSPDGLTIAATCRDKSVRVWDPATAQELLTLKGHQSAVHGIAFSPDGTILATGSHDGAIKLWRAPKSSSY